MHKNYKYILSGLVFFVALSFIFLNIYRGQSRTEYQSFSCGPLRNCAGEFKKVTKNYGFPTISLSIDLKEKSSDSSAPLMGKYIKAITSKYDATEIKPVGLAINIISAFGVSVLSSLMMAIVRRTIFRAHFRN